MEREKRSCATASDALLPGTILFGRYRIDRLLGQGGFGITYVAMDMQTHEAVAVKELFPSGFVTREPDRRTLCIYPGKEEAFSHLLLRFEQEAQTLMRLQGREGVIRVTHLFGENRSAYYVMELLVGEDLSHRLTGRGTMTWPQLAPILEQLMKALEQIHHVGLIHRDISPDNIFLTNDGSVRLIDFGSVRAYQGGDHFTALIKHGFAPWEQYLTNGNQGPWTDIYALCVTAYYALSGQNPPRATERRLKDTILPLENLAPGVPRHICRVLHKGMAVLAEDRYHSIAQLRDALFEGVPTPGGGSGGVACLRGVMAGSIWQISPGSVLRIGRSPDCHVIYPPNTAGISRHQCVFFRSPDGQLLVRDEGSSFGTQLVGNGRATRLSPNVWYRVGDCHIHFGQQEEYAQVSR